MPHLANQIRFYHYISGVLAGQKLDPICSMCKAYTNTVSALREGLAGLPAAHPGTSGPLSGELWPLLEDARSQIAAVRTLDGAVGQKKAGNCKMPEGVCFVKSSKAILDRISGISPAGEGR